MGASNFDSIDEGGGRSSMSGKVVISKSLLIGGIIVTILVIVAVGLLAGLLGKETVTETIVVQPTTTTPPQKPEDTTTSSSTTSSTTTTTSTTTPQKSTTAPTTTAPTGPWSDVRLPPNLVPIHYTVDLQPVLSPVSSGKYMFNGSSTVLFTVLNATNYVIIHSNKLNYSEPADVKVAASDGSQVPVSDTVLFEPNQYLVVTMNESLEVGKNYTLFTRFVGELSDDLGGLYRSTYTDMEGNTVVIATTQMQPTDARKAFPCFDEPALKATFDISLWHESPNFAISNMPNISTELMYGNWMKTSFNTTAKMSTYLLAFVVCDFDYEEGATEDDVQTRIYARPEQIEIGNGEYARKITPKILDYFEEYFNVSYPLPKSDQIAVPDFAAGAMENWGLIIYRETALLYNSNVSSASNKQRVAAVVAHELAHQWFGNLISPLWWDELWLNEGFASYVEYLGTDKVEPTWKMLDQFVVSDLQRALSVDSLTSSRPIVDENVSTPSEINALFDTISYSKGACIIRMINEFTGEEAFKLGLENYLKEYAYGPVTHNQLFEFWEKATTTVNGTNPPKGFVDSMDTWMLQMGYPVINMKRSGMNVTISQERFLLDPNANVTDPPSPFNYQWDIPFWYKTDDTSSDVTLVWLEANNSITMNIPTDQYYIGNYGAYGYYRVNYDDENWRRITDALLNNFDDIDVKSRGQILDDAFSLARRGSLSYDIALGLTEFLRYDFEYVSWESALDVMSYFDLVLGRSKVYGVYSSYLLYLVQPLYDNVTWEDTDTSSHLEQFQRVNALGAACSYGNKNCTQEATNRFNEWKTTEDNNITPNLRTVVYCNAIANGAEEDWNFVWEQYLNETNSQERSKLEFALSCSKTPWIIRRFLDYVLNDTFVRKQDASSVFEDLCYNEYARDVTWDFIRSQWDYIYKVYGTGFFSFSGIISSCTSHFSTEFELEQLLRFIEENEDQLGSGLRTAEQAVEKTKTNIQWRANHEETVFNWLTEKLDAINSSEIFK